MYYDFLEMCIQKSLYLETHKLFYQEKTRAGFHFLQSVPERSRHRLSSPPSYSVQFLIEHSPIHEQGIEHQLILQPPLCPCWGWKQRGLAEGWYQHRANKDTSVITSEIRQPVQAQLSTKYTAEKQEYKV